MYNYKTLLLIAHIIEGAQQNVLGDQFQDMLSNGETSSYTGLWETGRYHRVPIFTPTCGSVGEDRSLRIVRDNQMENQNAEKQKEMDVEESPHQNPVGITEDETPTICKPIDNL